MPDDELWLLNLEDIDVCPLQAFAHTAVPSTSTSRKGRIEGYYTIRVRREARMGRLTGTATS